MAITISVADIGPIRSASVRLKPLTVFVGPNNAGKSVLATVVYAALSKRPGIPPATVNPRLYRYSRALPGTGMLPAAGEPAAWLVRLASNGFDEDVVPPLARDLLRRRVKDAFDAYADILGEELERCFGIDLADVRRVPADQHAGRIIVAGDTPPGRCRSA